MSTFSAKQAEVERQWLVIDLEGRTVGRAATEIATILRGKHKPIYTPHVDTGDYVIVVNAEKVVFKGNKWDDKFYFRHSGYPGGLKVASARELHERSPESIIKFAVQGMLPKNKLGRQMLGKLKIYTGPEHPHEAQQPVAHEFTSK